MNLQALEKIIGEKIIREQSLGGGSIADSRVITTADGRRLFLKQGFANEMFQKEAAGLKELGRSGAIAVPAVIEAGADFLLLQWIETGVKKDGFFERFGRQLAHMHRFTADEYGFKHDNYIGSTPQINLSEGEERHNWARFYWNKRLLYQFRLCQKNGYADDQFSDLFARLELVYPALLKGSEEPPTLLHGDLWGGNYLCNKAGEPVLIDPAVYYGHREADLGMTRLFGGFTPEFYKAYEEEFPLKPNAKGREPLYILYHVLNHLNLFGTGYYGQAIELMQQLVK